MGDIITLTVVHKSGGDLYFGDAMYCTRNADTPANTLFHERVRELDNERAITYPWWSRSGGASPVRYIDYINDDAYFDALVDDEWRDTVIDIYVVLRGAAFSTAELVGTFLVENVTTPDTKTFRVNAYSVFEALDKTLTSKYSSGVSNEQFRNKAKPMSLGLVRWAYPSNVTLNDDAGSTRGIYDIADDYFEGINHVRLRGALIDESETALVGNSPRRYFVIQDADGYGFKLRGSTYRVAAEVQGQIRRGSDLVVSGNFPADDGSGYPVNFDINEGSGTISWVSASHVDISSSGVDAVYIAQDITFVSGMQYQIELDVTTLTGVLTISNGSTALRSMDSGGGLLHTAFTYSGADDVRVGFLTGASGSATIAGIRCYPAYRIDKLSEVMRFVASRTGVSTSLLDLAMAEDYEESENVLVNFASTDEVKGGELLRRVAESYGCAFYQANDGKLTPVKFEDPGTTADFELLEVDIAGTVEFEPDFAPGLSTRLKYDHNYNVHSDDDIVDISAGTAAGVALREKMRSEFRVVTTSVTLHSMYADALDRDPLDSLIREESYAQILIDEVCGLYVVARGFYTFRAFVTSTVPYRIRPGHVVKLFYSRYGLSAGKYLRVVYAKSSFGEKAVDLVLWG